MSSAVSAVISPRIAGVFMSATFPLNNSEKKLARFIELSALIKPLTQPLN